MKTIKKEQIDVIEIDNQHAYCEVSLFGGHILSYKPKTDNRARLWLSDLAVFDGKTPLRGGIPICWPWFSNRHGQENHSLPSHGYVRNQPWQLISQQDLPKGTLIVLEPTTTQGAGFSGQSQLRLEVLVGKSLSVNLITENMGDQSFNFTCALHSYFAVKDIRQTHLQGLSGIYEDNTQGLAPAETPTPYAFTEETDRVHLTNVAEVSIVEPEANTKVGSSGHDSLVVWNPWLDKARALKDMPDNGYLNMLCVETAVTQGLRLEPGEQHRLTQIID